jgi:peptidoglycan/xylan/chitin deacetylase (PgdA/CDA1 family)
MSFGHSLLRRARIPFRHISKQDVLYQKVISIRMIMMKKILTVTLILLLIAIFLNIFGTSTDFRNTQVSQSSSDNLVKVMPSPEPTSSLLPAPIHSGRQIRIPILTYHYVGMNPNPEDKIRDNLEITPEKFEDQMRYLSENGFQTIDFDRLYAVLSGKATLEPKSIILTFDDGYIDFYINAFPILKQFNLRAVSFIPTGLIGSSYYMNWNQIREINSTGLISFQAHSVNHLDLTTLNDAQLEYQLGESKKVIEQNLGKIVNTFAYPYGNSNPSIWQATKNAGYIGAVGTWVSSTISEGVIFDMPRIKISGKSSLDNFISQIN